MAQVDVLIITVSVSERIGGKCIRVRVDLSGRSKVGFGWSCVVLGWGGPASVGLGWGRLGLESSRFGRSKVESDWTGLVLCSVVLS